MDGSDVVRALGRVDRMLPLLLVAAFLAGMCLMIAFVRWLDRALGDWTVKSP